LWLLWLVVDLFDRAVVPLIPDAYNPTDILGRNIPGVGSVIVLQLRPRNRIDLSIAHEAG